jgi:hypothetical protein
MLIVWGTMSLGVRRGWVADYCPICRNCTTFRAKQMRLIPHLMFVPLWIGKPVMWRCRCSECRTRTGRPGRFYLRSLRRQGEPLEMVEQTNPMGTGEIDALLDRESRIDEGIATFEERVESGCDALNLVSLEIEMRCDRGKTRSVSSLIAIALIVTATAAFACWAASSIWAWPVTIAAVSLLVLLAYHVTRGVRRSKERIVGELLARACPRDAHDEVFIEQILSSTVRSGNEMLTGLKTERVASAAAEHLGHSPFSGAQLQAA